jgi:hypothetical protein
VVEHGDDHAVGGHNVTNSTAKHLSPHGNYQESQVRTFDRTAVLSSSFPDALMLGCITSDCHPRCSVSVCSNECASACMRACLRVLVH